jgi:hypothetical protein
MSFTLGIYLTTQPSSQLVNVGNKNVVAKPIDLGFEPPVESRRKPPREDKGVTRHKTHQTNNNNDNNIDTTISQDRSRITPRIVGLQITPNSALVYQISSSRPPNNNDDTYEYYTIEPSWYEPNAEYFMDGHDFDKCIPMADWQLESFVDCNKFHELDLSKMRMINRG